MFGISAAFTPASGLRGARIFKHSKDTGLGFVPPKLRLRMGLGRVNLRAGFFKNEGSDKMNELTNDRDEQVLSNELPDEAVEIAAGKYGEAGNPFTIAFCTGLDTCPA
jgi:hypothetical protein